MFWFLEEEDRLVKKYNEKKREIQLNKDGAI